jgi:ribosomal protein S18 acetylase RimI-like enzyme
MNDLDALIALEEHFCEADRLSRRSFRHFISSPKSTLFIAEIDDKVAGCAIVLYRKGSTLARLYTIATATEFQRRGVGRFLLAAAEKDAKRRRCRAMRLEVRKRTKAIKLYERSGYLRFGERLKYYCDRFDAWRYEKPLAGQPRRRAAVLPVRA